MAESLTSLLGSKKIGRTDIILRHIASTKIDEYQQRLPAVSQFYDLLLEDLIADICNNTRFLRGINIESEQ
jgi:hypothetical protein